MILTALAFLASTIFLPVHFAPAPVESPHCTGTIRAESQDESAAVVTSTLDARESAIIEIPYTGRWLVSLRSETCWAAPVLVDAESAGRGVELRRWPRAVITGSLLMPPRQQAPGTIQLELRPAAPRERAGPGDPLATVSCPVIDGQWKCDVPSTPLDIRIRADGFAPAYFWNVQFDKDRADMHRVSLRPGASLIGWVEDAHGDPVAGAEVQMAPQQVNRQTARVSGQAVQTRKAVSNERGFFQFQEIASGNFTITARTKARAVAAPREVSIRDGDEHRLPGPVILESPAAMLVQIDPPLAPDRQPWNVRLSRLLLADSTYEPAASGRASDLGTWSAEGIERGPHHIEILDSSGSVVSRLDTDVDRDTAMVHVEIGKVRVEGRVRFGTEPMASELKFFSAQGDVRMTSGDDGAFSAWLPKDGSWNVQITPKDALQRVRTRVDVRVPSDATHATLNIDLPAGRLAGLVVDEDGKPMPETEVIVWSGSDVLANAGTDQEGRFLIAGLEPGPVVLQAKNGALSSENRRCTVTATAASRETLVLRAPAELKGRVVHPSGAAVVGALIRYFDEDELLTTASGPTGEFSLTLRSGVPFADIVVITPRLPVVVDRVQSGPDERVVVVPDLAAVIQVAPRPGALPRIGRAGTRILPISMLFAPRQGFGPPFEVSNGAFELNLAPGQYNVCYSSDGDCIQVAAQGGAIARVNPPKTEGGT
jgi:hypothetical protein